MNQHQNHSFPTAFSIISRSRLKVAHFTRIIATCQLPKKKKKKQIKLLHDLEKSTPIRRCSDGQSSPLKSGSQISLDNSWFLRQKKKHKTKLSSWYYWFLSEQKAPIFRFPRIIIKQVTIITVRSGLFRFRLPRFPIASPSPTLPGLGFHNYYSICSSGFTEFFFSVPCFLYPPLFFNYKSWDKKKKTNHNDILIFCA